MFKLKATLVTMTRIQPWRTGWPMDRGVDFSLSATVRPVTPAPTARADRVPAERNCFMDEDRVTPVDAAATSTLISAAAAEAARDTPSEDGPDSPGLRAWWSLSGKTSRT